jgi:hypothetical protein
MAATQYAIRCTPGGLLRDDRNGRVITFASYAEAEAEALRLTKKSYSNPRIAGFNYARACRWSHQPDGVECPAGVAHRGLQCRS